MASKKLNIKYLLPPSSLLQSEKSEVNLITLKRESPNLYLLYITCKSIDHLAISSEWPRVLKHLISKNQFKQPI